MKNAVRLALLCMAATAIPAYAQTALPQCVNSNLDSTRQLFTIVNPSMDAVNQQCLLSVYQAGSVPESLRQTPAGYFLAGRYVIDLSGGGGGGGGGATGDKGGGGGGAGAAPSRTTQYLAPGTYKLTIGTGGSGGRANGGRTESGNPTSLMNISTGQLVAGFPGADMWTQQSRAADKGQGGVGQPGGSTGGSGGGSSPGIQAESAAQTGSASSTPGYNGVAGQAGGESGRSSANEAGTQVVQANAGGGGGASAGNGGSGDSAGRNSVAGAGDLGGGGGGGRGGVRTADAGGEGGHGFIRLSLLEATPQALAPVPVVMAAPAPVVILVPVRQKYSLSSDALFGFGKTDLMPSGEAQLDELVGKLNGINVESITDVGHADRIGSPSLNQRVSERRAESVKAYLVNKGIPSHRISASGMGETQPITSRADCKGATTAKLIACLQPDRRVDIEVLGTAK